MTRIRTVPPSEADESLRRARAAQHALYPPEYDAPVLPQDDEIAGIVAAHSLIPEALHHAFATFGSLMSPDLPLSRRQHEMIATVVSVTNRTPYCTLSHTEFLRRATGDDALADAIRRDFRTAPLLGLRFDTVFLHDGRARSIDEAIRMHDGSGSEAAESVALYRALSTDDRDALLDFVGAL